MNNLIGEPEGTPDLQMVHQEFVASIDRLMCDELDLDQLETISRILADISTTYDPNLVRAKAAHYDGLFRGVLAYRKRMKDGALTPPADGPTLWSHPHKGSKLFACELCGLADAISKPHQRWAEGLRGHGSDDL